MPDTARNSPNNNQPPEPERVRWLREQISELKKSWPAHSVPPGMLQRLEELEEELEEELSTYARHSD